MNKKQIIITSAGGLISFVGMFGLALLTTKIPSHLYGDSNQPALAATETDGALQPPKTETNVVGINEVGNKIAKQTMSERQLKGLVCEVQERIQQYNSKLKDIKLREQRLQMAQDTLKKDAENFDNMRVELASIVATLKNKRNELLKTRLEINQAEKTNLISIAATYDKMDAASAGSILRSMCVSESQGKIITEGEGLDDAVKILHYMTERTKAKVLAELVTAEPKLAAVFCQKLKQIVEGK